jgi:hypothetical protein
MGRFGQGALLAAGLCLATLFPAVADARGGHGGGGHGGGHGAAHGGGHGAGGHGGAGGVIVGHGVAHPVVGARFGGRFGGHLYIGLAVVWAGAAHWGVGFWAWGSGAWLFYDSPWWVAPEYPGWVWMGQPWVWDGTQWVSQDGYWTTADVPPGVAPQAEPPGFELYEMVDPSTWPAQPPPAGPEADEE